MTNFNYNRNIPGAANNPSNDQSLMLTNTNNIDSLINVDHYSFNVDNGGLHRQVTLPTETKPSTIAGQAAIYTKTAGQTQIFATTDTGANEYQLSRFVDASFTSFGKFGAFGSGPAGFTSTGGWTYLPGGLLLQYAQVVNAAGISSGNRTMAISFPIAFTTSSINIIITPILGAQTSSIHLPAVSNAIGAVTTTSFTIFWDASTTNYLGVNYQAIGI